jgi:membrane protein
MLRWLFGRMEAWVLHPGRELSRWRRLLVAWARLFLLIGRQLGQDRCLQQASALAFKSILSLVPLFVVSFFLFRSVGGLRNIGDQVQSAVFRGLNVEALVVVAHEGPTSRPISVSHEIDQRLDEVYRNLDVSAINIVGLLFLAFASTSLLGQMDHALNQVWKAPARRSFWVRLTTYWTVITFGPILLGASFYLANQVGQRFSQERVFSLVERVVAFGLPLVGAWLVFYLAYTLMPNTAVNRRAALIGAFVAALMLEVAKRAFSWYLAEFVPYSKVYGTLALLPIFLLWLHLLWVIFLFGAEWSYSVQNVRVLGTGAAPGGSGLARGEALAVNLVALIAERFSAGGRPLSVAQLAARLHAAEPEVHDLARLLAARRLLHRVVGRRERYQVARPPAQTPVAEVLAAVRDRFATPLPAAAAGSSFAGLRDFYRRLETANRSAVGTATVADLLTASEHPPTLSSNEDAEEG